MLDGLSLDQLRTFAAAADEGSFSAAARKLRRAQSVVSQTVANLEQQVGVPLFDRSGRYPRLTAAGTVLLADARSVLQGVDAMKARARGLAGGLEPELAAVVDALFPMATIAEAARDLQRLFPGTALRLYVEAIGAAYQPVLDGRCSLGIVGPLALPLPSLASEHLMDVEMVIVAARDHPLAAVAAPIPQADLARHVQLVLTDKSDLSAGREFGVMSPLNWRLADLFAKRAFLLNGLGWGGMPLHTVAEDLAAGRLVPLRIEGIPVAGPARTMTALYRTAAPPRPAGRWLIGRLKADLDGSRHGQARPGRRQATSKPTAGPIHTAGSNPSAAIGPADGMHPEI